jgi:hypothetical protein
MDLHLEWGQPVPLRRAPGNTIYSIDLAGIPKSPGIYVFFRTHGTSVSVLYVGKADNLKNRIKGQLNAVRLMRGIENAPTGARCVVYGEFKPRPGQRSDSNCLRLIERGLIRYYLAQGNELLNIQGSRIQKHSLTSERTAAAVRRLIPTEIFFEHQAS